MESPPDEGGFSMRVPGRRDFHATAPGYAGCFSGSDSEDEDGADADCAAPGTAAGASVSRALSPVRVS
jgi:hypothetical protein